MVIRGHEKNLPDSSLILKHLAQVEWCLFASPSFLTKTTPILEPKDLRGIKALCFGWKNKSWAWSLTRYNGEKADVPLSPQYSSDDMSTLKTACIKSLGMVSLPGYICKQEVADGQLVRVLPEWHSRSAALSIIMSSRAGVPIEVRTFIDFLRENTQEKVNFSF